jgi:hypothetical protein
MTIQRGRNNENAGYLISFICMAQPESPNSYANSIPALQVVGDPAAQALLGATRTNGVVAGTPVLR